MNEKRHECSAEGSACVIAGEDEAGGGGSQGWQQKEQ